MTCRFRELERWPFRAEKVPLRLSAGLGSRGSIYQLFSRNDSPVLITGDFCNLSTLRKYCLYRPCGSRASLKAVGYQHRISAPSVRLLRSRICGRGDTSADAAVRRFSHMYSSKFLNFGSQSGPRIVFDRDSYQRRTLEATPCIFNLDFVFARSR